MTEKTMREWPLHPSHYTMPMRYLLRGPKGKGTVVLLHGYQDHAMSMTKRIGWLENSDLPFQILAINAPFPVPIWKADSYLEAYSWYFRDTTRNLMIVDPNDSAKQVAILLEKVLSKNEPVVLFGFSQGGYLAPFLAQHTDVKGIIAAGSGYPIERYEDLKRLPVYGIHGAKDERIPVDASQSAHAKLVEIGFPGEFVILPELTHRVEPSLDPLVRKFAKLSFEGAA